MRRATSGGLCHTTASIGFGSWPISQVSNAIAT